MHTASGQPGGTVTIVVLRLTGAVRVEVIDHGSAASTPVVKGEVLAPDGHGLFLVDQLADSWGYVLDQVGTTVWFRLTGEPHGPPAALPDCAVARPPGGGRPVHNRCWDSCPCAWPPPAAHAAAPTPRSGCP